jgi:hypothetical protein
MSDQPARSVTVSNLATGAEITYVGITPYQAVICAYAHSLGDYNTWEYRNKYRFLVVSGRLSYSCGDWAALKENWRELVTPADVTLK